ncbi:MAG TPA: helix-turn-helix domain-containing protein [Polyangiaceae bacterium]|nr:helix-turn-helix domain-containing protein [Polyangiaceae bacterium]
MNEKHALSAAASLIAEPARAAMLVALLDGRALTAGELARAAEVSPQSASLHLSKLVDGGMLVVHPQGRHRYYRMAAPEIGHALEALGAIATIRPTKPVLRTPRDQALCFARTCYDHLAGTLGVELAAALEGKGIVTATEDRKYALGPDGPSWLTRWAIEDPSRRARHREFASRCLDWTERRPHIGGALGATLLASFIERRWLQRKPESRAMRITERGMRGFAELGIPALAIHHSSSPAHATYSKGVRSA